MTSRLAVRVGGLILAVAIVWYITHLNAEISRMRAATPGAASADRVAPPPAAAPVSTAPRSLSAEQRQAMLDKLGGAGSNQGHPVWFATVPNNPEAASFQKTLQGIFEEAGWQVRGTSVVRFPMKPGVYIFAADEEPPEYLSMVNDAFESAGLTVTSGRGYRDFVKQKKEENPDWVGIELGPEDTYVIAVGRSG